MPVTTDMVKCINSDGKPDPISGFLFLCQPAKDLFKNAVVAFMKSIKSCLPVVVFSRIIKPKSYKVV